MHVTNPTDLVYASDTSLHRYTHKEILKEISFFEARLKTVGHDGDCGYEQALAEMYHVLIKQRRDMLTRIAQQDGS